MKLRNQLTALYLLAPVAVTMIAVPSTVLAQEASPEVFSLQVNSDNGINTGSRLRLTLRGTPGASASVRIRGVREPIALNEASPGLYRGRYVVGPDDRIEPGDPIRATLRRGNRSVTASYDIPRDAANVAAVPPTADTLPPSIVNVQPREDESVPAGPVTVVSGRFDDRGGSGVDPASVRVMLSGHDVTRESQVSPDSFTFRGPLLPGRHTVDVTARDRAGNAASRSWSFEVASAMPNLQIEVLNHPNNGQVDRNGTVVRARTAPFATINIRVDAVPPIVGQVGVAREVLARTLQADANGNFDFSFTSPFPVPGTRYEVSMTASKADVRAETRLVLFQGQS